MTNIEQFLKLAIEGGMKEGEKWKFVRANMYWAVWLDGNGTETTIHIEKYLLDPKAWQAADHCKLCDIGSHEAHKYRMTYKENMHHFLDSLIDGKSIEAALGEILNN